MRGKGLIKVKLVEILEVTDDVRVGVTVENKYWHLASEFSATGETYLLGKQPASHSRLNSSVDCKLKERNTVVAPGPDTRCEGRGLRCCCK